MKKNVFFIVLTVASTILKAQNSNLYNEWNYSFTDYSQEVYALKELNENNVIMVNSIYRGFKVYKINKSGLKETEITFYRQGFETPFKREIYEYTFKSVFTNKKGESLISYKYYYSYSGDATGYGSGTQYVIVKIDTALKTVYTNYYLTEAIYKLQENSVGELYGITESNKLIKLNSSGYKIWDKTISGLTTSSDIKITNDDNLVFLSNSNTDIVLNKIDSVGNLIWSKTFGGSQTDVAKTLIQTKDRGYAIIGYSNSSDGDLTANNGLEDIWIVKTDSSGTLKWQKTIGTIKKDIGNTISQTVDGGFLISGSTQTSSSDEDGIVYQLDSIGNILFSINEALDNIVISGTNDYVRMAIKTEKGDYYLGVNNHDSNNYNKTSYLSKYIPDVPIIVQTPTETVPMMKIGLTTSVYLCEDSTLHVSGRGSSGQLGLGSNTLQAKNRTKISSISGIKNVELNSNLTLALKSDGTLWGWGRNNYGMLGNIDSIIFEPKLLYGFSDIKQMDVGSGHILTLKSDGSVWSQGDNKSGQLGTGNYDSSYIPIKVTGLTDVKMVKCGSWCSFALKNDGTVWAWGQNIMDELGVGSDYFVTTPVQIVGLTDIVEIESGNYHSLALKNDGTVYCWGSNLYGELGLGATEYSPTPTIIPGLKKIIDIEVNSYLSSAIDVNGNTFVWGYNKNSQLGLGTTSNISTPTKNNSLSGIKKLSFGYNTTSAILNNATIKFWGDNSDGIYGNNTTSNYSKPTTISYNCADVATGFVQAGVIDNPAVYPNPFITEINFTGLPVGSLLEIYDVSGRTIEKITATTTNETLNLSNTENGVYFYSITIGGVIQNSGKIIKQ